MKNIRAFPVSLNQNIKSYISLIWAFDELFWTLKQKISLTYSLVAIKVLTAFKKRRKRKLEQEKMRKERRKTLWKRLGFKLRVFNIFANKISSDDPTIERIVKLKRKLGRNTALQRLYFFDHTNTKKSSLNNKGFGSFFSISQSHGWWWVLYFK